jgi:hypothetical protein
MEMRILFVGTIQLDFDHARPCRTPNGGANGSPQRAQIILWTGRSTQPRHSTRDVERPPRGPARQVGAGERFQGFVPMAPLQEPMMEYLGHPDRAPNRHRDRDPKAIARGEQLFTVRAATPATRSQRSPTADSSASAPPMTSETASKPRCSRARIVPRGRAMPARSLAGSKFERDAHHDATHGLADMVALRH